MERLPALKSTQDYAAMLRMSVKGSVRYTVAESRIETACSTFSKQAQSLRRSFLVR